MRKFSESAYSPEAALKAIGARFWEKHRGDLLAYARDRSKTGIPEKIHDDWDRFWRCSTRTNRRIEWALALYDHGDWPGAETANGSDDHPAESVEQTDQSDALPPSTPKPHTAAKADGHESKQTTEPPRTQPAKQPSQKRTATAKKPEPTAIRKKCSNCYFSKNPDRCGHGMFGPCDEWREATFSEEHWPTREDMKRAEYADYRSRYREY